MKLKITLLTLKGKEWVRISTPHPICLSLEKLQGILNMEQSMDKDCFNITVRILACDEGVLFTDPPIHYMDLRFCSMMLESTQDQKFCEKETIQTLATLFDGWPVIDNNISSRNMDGYELKKQFLVYLLQHRGNKVKDNFLILCENFLSASNRS